MDLFSDSDDFSESSSSEDQDYTEFMYGGQANCILSSLEDSIGKIDDFLSFERGFICGDIVCSITDPTGPMGRVINVDMVVDMENVYGNKIKDVNSKSLGKIRSVSMGDYVVAGNWLGKIEKVVDSVTILFDDGTKCEFTTMGPEKLIPISPDLLEDSEYPYYPGQRVKVEFPSVSKSSRWFCSTQMEKQDEGTVFSLDAGMVHVEWLGSALVGCAPPCLQDSKNLTLLSCFTHANWQLGDWCMLSTADCQSVAEKLIYNAGFIKEHRQSEKEFWRSCGPDFQEIFVIVKTKTKVDVLWQDGSQALGLDSHSLFPVNIVDAHDFWPEQFVLEKGTSDDPHVPDIQRWGVVKSVDAKERTVRVKWESFRATDLDGKQLEETVSAYELVEHPDYSFCLGDAVFSLQKGQFVDEMDRQYEDYSRDKNKYRTESYLSQIGIVVGFRDGYVEVKWATGLATKVAPYEIFRVEKHEGLSVAPVLNEENVEEADQEMIENEDQGLGQKGKDLSDFDGDGEDCGKITWDAFLPQVAFGFFSSIASSLFGSLGYTSPSDTSDHVSEDAPRSETHVEEVMELCNFSPEGPESEVAEMQTTAKTNSRQKVDEIQDIKTLLNSSSSKYHVHFRQFDVVSGCLDHHFLDDAGKSIALSSQVKRGWLKKVQQEWSILEKDLPATIYIRVYEERMDLLRAAIVGAPGTPYHDGLFFFDIFLPPEYPHEPPLVNYNSGGLRVNPNLYESGKVCLSLLNTWTGKGTEVWNPGSSTILQVLLSLQALVLNEKPYFNEAGYDKQIGRAEGEKNSASYNENAFLVNCKSMLYLLRKPPKHFEALVEEHFRKRGKYILSACKSYMEGVPVGCAFGDGKSDEENKKGSSTGFKIMLDKLFPKLVESFSDKGIDCSMYTELGN